MTQKRLSPISKTKEIFYKIKDPYEKTLKIVVLKEHYHMFKIILSARKKLRKKKVFYYNPPFRNCIKTNIGKTFLKLVSKHFPKSGFYDSIFNRNK